MATVRCLFDRPHHQRVAALLQSLDAGLMARHHCLFGGGTAIALRFGEFRESRDVDFLVSSLDAYRAVRSVVTSMGIDGLFVRPCKALREARIDQYGIRTVFDVGGVPIKFEILREARIDLDVPRPEDEVCGVRTLTTSDLVAEKLLANSDRWSDDSVHSRDLIDLAMMLPDGKIPPAALAKALRAYASIKDDLQRAVEHLAGRPGRIQTCLAAMQMTLTAAQAMHRVRRLRFAAPAKGSPPARPN